MQRRLALEKHRASGAPCTSRSPRGAAAHPRPAGGCEGPGAVRSPTRSPPPPRRLCSPLLVLLPSPLAVLVRRPRGTTPQGWAPPAPCSVPRDVAAGVLGHVLAHSGHRDAVAPRAAAAGSDPDVSDGGVGDQDEAVPMTGRLRPAEESSPGGQRQRTPPWPLPTSGCWSVSGSGREDVTCSQSGRRGLESSDRDG